METGALAYGEAFGAAPHMDAAIGKTPIAAEIAAQVVALTCTEPRHQATHWTGRAMAKAIGISLGSVQRIWRAHKLQPHRLRTLPSREDPRGQEYHKLLRWAGHPVFIGFVAALRMLLDSWMRSESAEGSGPLRATRDS